MIEIHAAWLAVIVIFAMLIGATVMAFFVVGDDGRDHNLTRDSDPFKEPWC